MEPETITGIIVYGCLTILLVVGFLHIFHLSEKEGQELCDNSILQDSVFQRLGIAVHRGICVNEDGAHIGATVAEYKAMKQEQRTMKGQEETRELEQKETDKAIQKGLEQLAKEEQKN